MKKTLMDNGRAKLVGQARQFEQLLNDPGLTEEEINAAIEELRPLRFQIHALDYGSAPGYRVYDREVNGGDSRRV